MQRRKLVGWVLALAIGAFAAVAVATSMDADSSRATHTMPNGAVMDGGQMP